MVKWTEARLRTFIFSALRNGMRRYPPKYEALKKACVGRCKNEKTGRLAMHYQCKKCEEFFVKKDVQVDHKKPVVDPRKGFVDWNEYIPRLFCRAGNLQVLCKPCHKKKTLKERKKRK
jgi:5-methylcytosine-specific restriction endonuclease McrA